MSRVNIYIRKEDEAKWKAIENKPEWLHEHLNPIQLFKGIPIESRPEVPDSMMYIMNKGQLRCKPTLTPPEDSV